MNNTSCILVFFALSTIISIKILPVTCAWTYFIGTNIDIDQHPKVQDIVDAVNFCNSIFTSTDLNRILRYQDVCGKITNLINQGENIIDNV
ncbi:Hypothetical protein SRAE_X000207400 [Strongyloides ratti]|uniref:Uncharacterized protein n=1 Tax=Strongyloides ratti TaxID=34506 RepID=A0A090KSF6_STRRB|nr:Hypothetical protein SRAE_X000207400 [Strongyloides ratti]CEF60336.1 Hypothetical protein SRAE_X000207400 [Strongyloides ratti]